jgi:NADH-quinone oxidoreductase subunit J
MEMAVFLVGALVILAGALGVVLNRNPVHSALSLLATLFGVALLFLAQDANFLAAVQVIVYAGAIVVLFLFVIMLLGVASLEELRTDPLVGQRPAGILAGLALGAGLLFVVLKSKITGAAGSFPYVDKSLPDVTRIAHLLFTEYLFGFEITSVLLVIAVVGAVLLARRRPGMPIIDDTALDADEPVAFGASEEVAP